MNESITEDFITCPHCQFVDVDSFEYPDTAEIECSECGCSFTAYRNVSVFYTMVKKEGER